jgi:DNA-binding response OmpR family regulator
MPVTILSNKRILVVEDEAIVADMLQDMLTDLGAVVVGPVGTIARSLDLARSEPIDAAILDVNVRNERIDPVAELLRERRVPIVFATGYGQSAALTANGATIIEKPYTKQRIVAALSSCLRG